MSGNRHVCRRVSEQKKNAYLGWINGLVNEGASAMTFMNFEALRKSGSIVKIAYQLSKSQSVSNDGQLHTLLSNYYGENFINTNIITAITSSDNSSKGCSCELDFQTAMVVALLLNLALTDQKCDASYVQVCIQLSPSEQQEVANTCKFLATESVDRSAPSDIDWKGFLYSPPPESHQTPVSTRRSIQPQKLIIAESPLRNLPTTPQSVHSSRRNSAEVNGGPFENFMFDSPIIEVLKSPVVRSTARLREKTSEIQKLKRDLSEKTYLYDQQSVEFEGLMKKLESAEFELAQLRQSEKNLRSFAWDIKFLEEQSSTKSAKIIELEKQLEKLSGELEIAKSDRDHFKGIENERTALYTEINSLSNDRDNLERKVQTAEMELRRVMGQFSASKENHKIEIDAISNKNERLLCENKKLRDIADEVRFKEEEIIKANNEITSLKNGLFEKETKINELENMIKDLQEKIRSLESSFNADRGEYLEQIQSLKKSKDEIEEEEKKLNAHINSLINERDNLERKVQTADGELRRATIQFNATNENHKIEMDALSNKKERLVCENKKFADEVRSKEEEIIKGNKEIVSLKNGLFEKETKINELEKMIKDLQEKIRLLESSFHTDRASYLEQIQSLKKSKDETEEEKKMQNKQLITKSVIIGELEKQVQTLSGELEIAKTDGEHFKRMETERTTSLYAQINSLTNERDNLERKVQTADNELRRSTAQFNATADNHKIEMDALSNKNERLMTEIEHLRDNANIKEEEIIKANREIGSLKNGLFKKESQINEMEKMINEQQEKIELLESSFNTDRDGYLEQIQSLKISKDEIEEEEKKLNAKINSLTNERDNLERKVQTADNELRRATVQFNATNENHKIEMDALSNRNERLTTEIKRLRDNATEIEIKEEEINKANREIASLKNGVLKKESQINEMEKMINEQQEKIELLESSFGKERDGYKAQIHALKSNVEHLEGELNQVKKDRDTIRTSVEEKRQNTTYLMPGKRVRQDSSRSATSVGTFAGSSSVVSDHRHSRFANCEDEDEVMLESAVEMAPAGDAPEIRISCAPAQRLSNGITPGRQRLFDQSTNSMDTTFKAPLPIHRSHDDLKRSLAFHGEKSEDQDEWQDASVFKNSLQQPETPDSKYDPFRLSILNERNHKLPAHLKSSYPVETQALTTDVKDEELKHAPRYQPPPDLQEKVNMKTPKYNKKLKTATPKGGQFLSRFGNKLVTNSGSKDAKPAAAKAQENLPENATVVNETAIRLDFNGTPAKKKRTFPWMKKDEVPSSILNLKNRRVNEK